MSSFIEMYPSEIDVLLGMVAHVFNSSVEVLANLVYRASSRIARATQRNPVSKNQTKRKKHKTF